MENVSGPLLSSEDLKRRVLQQAREMWQQARDAGAPAEIAILYVSLWEKALFRFDEQGDLAEYAILPALE